MPTYRVSHRTTYAYREEVSISRNRAHVTPRNSANQVCVASLVHIDPHPSISELCRDYFGNTVTFFTVEDRHDTLTVHVESLLEVSRRHYPHPLDTIE